MTRVARLSTLVLFATVLGAMGCAGAAKPPPLPGGPPPEYEPPRDFPGGAIGDHAAGAEPAAVPPGKAPH